ncbi:hypothetical protein RSOLAG1IB_03434 [Rhizoctonia solani AG-1 IB]|nr:hypothetical protein RSOLAG1IB_03434 [Rhizoctonia solani AG-1 IB]
MQPQPPPLPAALVPHDVMAEEWDRCMQGLISLTSQILPPPGAPPSARMGPLEPLLDLVTQWNTTFFIPRGVDISVYKGSTRRSGPQGPSDSAIRHYDDYDSETSSSSSSSTESSEEDDRYFASARREERASKRAERKARRKERRRRRRARKRDGVISIRVRAVPLPLRY